MQIRKAGWAALLAAAGVWLCLSAPVQAATARAKPGVANADKPIVLSKFSKRKSHAAKKARATQRRHAKTSSAKPASRKVAKTSDEDHAAARPAAALPPAVAEAHAEAPASRTFAEDEARNIAALDDTDVVSNVDGVQIAAAGQLNDMDRAAEAAPAPPAPAPAPAVEAPVSAPKMFTAVPATDTQTARPGESDPWSKTSLIGKIFIALGSLLTLASAARLLIA
jgi:hypothetical protein